jgi:hypothetical protein
LSRGLVCSADANYGIRYQYFEPTIVNTAASVDLSYIDFVAISMSMRAVNAPHAQNSIQTTRASGLTLVNAASKAAQTAQGNILPSPGAKLPNPSFARVISPSLRGNLYHDWTNYLTTFLPGKTASIQGCFGGVDTQPTGNSLTQAQSYDFTASFQANGDVILTSNPGSGDGASPCVPAAQQGTGVGTNQTVTIKFADLNAGTGIYGNNPPYTINNNPPTTGIVNDYFGWVVGDLLAGLTFGFPGSTVLFNGTEIGQLPSTKWWGGEMKMPDGTVIHTANTPAGQNVSFGKAQPGQPQNYDNYAASLIGLTPGYGSAFQDRLGQNLMVFDTGVDTQAYLLVTVNRDSSNIDGNLPLLLGE